MSVRERNRLSTTNFSSFACNFGFNLHAKLGLRIKGQSKLIFYIHIYRRSKKIFLKHITYICVCVYRTITIIIITIVTFVI